MTTEKTQINTVSAVHTDSASTDSTATHSSIQAQTDSLFQATLRQTFETQRETALEQTLRLYIFDTLQPIDTATGVPPLRALLTQTTAATRKDTSTGRHEADVNAEKHAETAENADSVGTHADQQLRDQQDSLAALNHWQAEKEKKAPVSWQLLALVAAVLAIVIAAVCRLIKRKLKPLAK